VGFDEAAKVFAEAYGADAGHRGRVVIDTAPRSRRPRQDPDDDTANQR
jgi:hypothetical protein